MASHTSVFGALNWITERLETANWPSHPDSTLAPAVGVGDSYTGQPAGVETVDVVYRIEDDATIEWVSISPGTRDERFLVDIYIRSMLPGMDRPSLWARLAELAETVTGVFYTPETHTFVPVGWLSDAGPQEPWYHPLGGVARVAPQAWPTDQGWCGDCMVTVACHTRI